MGFRGSFRHRREKLSVSTRAVDARRRAPGTHPTRLLAILLLPIAPFALAACAPGSHAGIPLAAGAADPELQSLARNAEAGDKQAQLELGIRYEEGRGVPIDLERAERLYRFAASDSGGPLYVHRPAVGDAPGRVVRHSPGIRQSGLVEARRRMDRWRSSPSADVGETAARPGEPAFVTADSAFDQQGDFAAADVLLAVPTRDAILSAIREVISSDRIDRNGPLFSIEQITEPPFAAGSTSIRVIRSRCDNVIGFVPEELHSVFCRDEEDGYFSIMVDAVPFAGPTPNRVRSLSTPENDVRLSEAVSSFENHGFECTDLNEFASFGGMFGHLGQGWSTRIGCRRPGANSLVLLLADGGSMNDGQVIRKLYGITVYHAADGGLEPPAEQAAEFAGTEAMAAARLPCDARFPFSPRSTPESDVETLPRMIATAASSFEFEELMPHVRSLIARCEGAANAPLEAFLYAAARSSDKAEHPAVIVESEGECETPAYDHDHVVRTIEFVCRGGKSETRTYGISQGWWLPRVGTTELTRSERVRTNRSLSETGRDLSAFLEDQGFERIEIEPWPVMVEIHPRHRTETAHALYCDGDRGLCVYLNYYDVMQHLPAEEREAIRADPDDNRNFSALRYIRISWAIQR